MKKIVIVLSLFVCLVASNLVTPKANAGIITVIGSISELQYETGRAIGGIAAGSLATWGGFVLANANTGPWHVVGVVLIVLDAKQEFKQSGVELFLAKKYPFINDLQTLSSLARLVKDKVISSGGLIQSLNVKIQEQEIRSTLAASPLADEQVDLIANDLR